MTDRYYRSKKDSPALLKGAILMKKDGSASYVPINDLYFTEAINEENPGTWSAYIVEHAPEWYERVYPVNLLTKTVYKLKEEARELFEKEYIAK